MKHIRVIPQVLSTAAALLLASISMHASPVTVTNGIQFATNLGATIHAHGGGVVQAGGYYYWFGENRIATNNWEVSCYRSTDLATWEYRGAALNQNSAAELANCKIERPKVIYNAATNTYAMWMHYENAVDYSLGRCAVAYSSTVEGPYTYIGSFQPFNTYSSRDCTAFVDTDGKGYFISSANNNYDLMIYEMTPDFRGLSRVVGNFWVGAHREAPALVKSGGTYFLMTSAATGWAPNQAQYVTATSMDGPWDDIWTNVGDGTTYYSQPAFILPVQGTSKTSYLYLGDRWAGAWGEPSRNSRYVWLPLSLDPIGATMSMSWSQNLNIDTAIGTITGSAAISQGKPTSASSVQTGNDAFKGNDGDFNSRWTAVDGTYPQWWKVDLGVSKALTGAQIYWYASNSRSYRYKIEVSTDNVNFTTVSDQTARTGKGISLDAFSVTARYVRITSTGVTPSGGYAAFFEASLY